MLNIAHHDVVAVFIIDLLCVSQYLVSVVDLSISCLVFSPVPSVERLVST
jgi:hypothetical protein